MYPGETLGIVGESGSGKTTMGRCLLRIYDPQAGAIDYRRPDGQMVDIRTADKASLQKIRREVRMIFQDPVGSLNPRMNVGQIIAEPLKLAGMRGRELDDRVAELMLQVGLEPAWRERYPARLLRRPAAAHRHRPRDRDQPASHHCRRGHLGA